MRGCAGGVKGCKSSARTISASHATSTVCSTPKLGAKRRTKLVIRLAATMSLAISADMPRCCNLSTTLCPEARSVAACTCARACAAHVQCMCMCMCMRSACAVHMQRVRSAYAACAQRGGVHLCDGGGGERHGVELREDLLQRRAKLAPHRAAHMREASGGEVVLHSA